MTGDLLQGYRLRLLEAALFASATPLDEAALRQILGDDAQVEELVAELAAHYEGRGVQVARVGGGWAFRTAPDLAGALRVVAEAPRRLSRAALETLAIIAYHQPVTRAEIESIRGVAVAKGTLDALLAAGWIRPGKRRATVGRPVTWVTTPAFLDHFGLDSLDELPAAEELRAAGLIDARPAGLVAAPADPADGDEAD